MTAALDPEKCYGVWRWRSRFNRRQVSEAGSEGRRYRYRYRYKTSEKPKD